MAIWIKVYAVSALLWMATGLFRLMFLDKDENPMFWLWPIVVGALGFLIEVIITA